MERITALLEKEYDKREWQPDGKPLAGLVRTILSQNTSDTNSKRAFNMLMSAFGNWQAIASAPVQEIAYAIRVGGLSKVKAVRIKEILNQIRGEQGGISLDFLSLLDASEAKDYLMKLPGVGEKTANCVLLFSLGKPCLPVDTHVFRVAKRLGLIDAKVSIGKAHSLLQQHVPPAKVYQFHILMIEHGRKICRARNPECDRCILSNDCPSSSAHQR
ncbi:Ultraviolet N-glycosylase/AP lyase [subsurface metagenome]